MHGKALPEDCFAQFDQAFAELEANLIVPKQHQTVLDPSPQSPPQEQHVSVSRADLSEFEEAFSNIDRELAKYPSSIDPVDSASVSGSTTPSSPLAGERRLAPAEGATRPECGSDAEMGEVAQGMEGTTPAVQAMRALEPSSNAAALQTRVECDWGRPSIGGTPLEMLVGTIQNLVSMQRGMQMSGVAQSISIEDVAELFADVRQICVDFDLPTARVRADFALAALEQGHRDRLTSEISELIRHLKHDLHSCSILPIPRRRMWAFSLALDERTSAAFPGALEDVTEAGRCVGLGLQSAAVFHMLRAANVGRRALAVAVRTQPFTPAAVDWQATIDVLQAKLTTGGWTGAAPPSSMTEFFSGLLNDARVLLDADRLVASGMHLDENYTVAVVQTAHRFLQRLSEYVSERQQRPLSVADFAAPTRLP